MCPSRTSSWGTQLQVAGIGAGAGRREFVFDGEEVEVAYQGRYLVQVFLQVHRHALSGKRPCIAPECGSGQQGRGSGSGDSVTVGEPPAGMSRQAHARRLVLGAQRPPVSTTAAGRK